MEKGSDRREQSSEVSMLLLWLWFQLACAVLRALPVVWNASFRELRVKETIPGTSRQRDVDSCRETLVLCIGLVAYFGLPHLGHLPFPGLSALF